jgi:hypothetical protein
MRRRPTRGEASGRARWWAAGEGWAAGFHRAKAGENEIPFSFSFSIISKHFQMVLNPILNLNQTTQHKKFKYNSMSAQTCFYPYI